MLNRRRFLQGAAVVSAAATSRAMLGDVQVPFIDSHVHVWKHDVRFPFAAGAKVPSQDFSAEDLLALMRANKVARTVLIQVIHYRWDNSYLADVLGRYPKKFRGVCRIDPEDPKAPDTLSQLTEQGFRGVRLSPHRPGWVIGFAGR